MLSAPALVMQASRNPPEMSVSGMPQSRRFLRGTCVVLGDIIYQLHHTND